MNFFSSSKSLIQLIIKIFLTGLIGIVCIFATYSYFQNLLMTEYKHLVTQESEAERKVMMIRYHFKMQVQEWKNVLIRGSDLQKRDKYWTNFQAEEEIVQQLSKELSPTLDQKGQSLIQEFIQAHQQLSIDYRRGFKSYVDNNANITIADQAVAGVDRQPTELLNEAVDHLSDLTLQVSNKISEQSKVATQVFLPMMALFFFAITYAIVWLLKQYVGTPIATIIKRVNDFSQGDFSQNYLSHGVGELNKLHNQLDQMQNGFADIFQNMRSTSEMLTQTAMSINTNTADVKDYFKQVTISAETVVDSTSNMNKLQAAPV